MIAVRSALFNAAYATTTLLLALAGLPLLLGPPRWSSRLGRIWGRATMFWLRLLVGIDYEVRGTPPTGPVIVASKHQSTWDTMIMPVLIDAPAFVLKRELLFVPLVGFYLRRAGCIAVDRTAGPRALKAMLRDAERAAAAGRPILIYPEGTRTAPGATQPYHPGVAALYTRLGLPVVPVALDSGLYWGRRSFRKRPGTVVIEFLEPIPPGLDRRAFASLLEERIEGASLRLRAEARERPVTGRRTAPIS